MMRLTSRTRCAWLIGVLLSISVSAQAAESQKTEPISPTEGVIQLFNGKDLSGLYTWLKDTKYEDPKQVFTVKDGVLNISGDGWGGIATKEAYGDYHLICEFKWGERTWGKRKERTRDSGLLVHCSGPDGGYGGIWMASIEAQIIEGGVGDILVVPGKHADGSPVLPLSLTAEVGKDRDGENVWKKGGERKTFPSGRINWYGRDPDWKDEIGFRGKEDVDSPVGEWTRYEVICDGGHILVKVNGTVVNEGFDAEPTTGKITIQSEGAEILIRRWELWPLGKAPAAEKESPAAETGAQTKQAFRAGAFAIDVSPTEFPVLVNGGMNEGEATELVDPLHARCLVLDDGTEQLAIVVVDSCMIPRELLDEAKTMAHQATGIPPERILISATHTHSAPSVISVLGSRRDEAYSHFLPGQIAKGIKLAQKQLAPARIGWAMGRDEKNVACRRWLMKPGTAGTNLFGGTKNDRATMHPGYGNPNAIRPTGPVDPDVAVLSVQTLSGKPLAIVSNYSMHYVGAPSISADYFAVFCHEIGQLVGADSKFVAMLSNGTSGDTWCLDHAKPKRKIDRFDIAKDVAQAAYKAYQSIRYHDWVPLAMEEKRLTLDVRMPSEEEVAEAKEYLAAHPLQKGKSPTTVEVYAGETVKLSQMPSTRELKLQAIRIGDLGITAIPNEVFASTGLAIKKQSPLAMTFNISLANGADGYIPPPEQHKLGGYTTWRARSSCLEVGAEPKITQAVLELLQKVSHQREQETPLLSAQATSKKDASPATENDPEQVASPINARDSLDYIHLRDGFRIELVASEPKVIDPVAYDWGPDGKLWVVEMADYPLGLDGQGKSGGRVRYLEDTTGDGKYDKSTLFATGLNFPNGISVWRKGVLVTAAPEILYLEDSNGDGKADIQKTLYKGITEGNPQLRVNGLRWGMDGWVYCANGLSTVDKIESVKTGEQMSIRGRDMRIRPDEGLLDPQLGSTQFGRNRDDWGNWFGVSNSNPMWHFVLADQYLRRNPHFATPSGSSRNVSITPGKATIFARSAKGRFFHASEVGRFTSANSTIVYRDELFGPEFYPNSFVSEPVHNLIHREVMQPNDVTYTSQRAEDEQTSEFLASTDTWFRPNMIRTGPDGGLWIADIYREIIDHPQYIPKDQHARLDFRMGDQYGRIYRVLPEGKEARPIPRLDGLGDTELAALMESPNGTLRDMVQKQIVWGQKQACVPVLEKLAQQSDRAASRLQSLWTLECLDKLKSALVLQALSDAHPGVRRGAVRLAEGKFDRNSELGQKLVDLVHDPDAHVRLQLACTLGEWHDPRAAVALAQLGVQDAEEPLIVAAVLSSLRADNVGPVLETLLSLSADGPPEGLVGQVLSIAVGYGKNDVASYGLAVLTTPNGEQYDAWQLGALGALAKTLRSKKQLLKQLAQQSAPDATVAQEKLKKLFKYVRQLVDDLEAPQGKRIRAMRLLGNQRKQAEEDWALLGNRLALQETLAIQTAAVEALARTGKSQVPEILLQGWKSHSPRLRTPILDVLLGRLSWTKILLDKIEQGEIAGGELDATRREQLTKHRDKPTRGRAVKLLAGSINPDRQKVLQQWESTLALEGNYQRGTALFTKRCAVCHQLDGQGHPVGPDLAALTDKSTKTLLLAILDPNQAIDARYLSYLAVTDEGLIYTGILVQESGNSITLKSQDGKQHVLLRDSLEEIQCTGKSLMPEGLEKDITPQDLADLIAYVAGPRTDAIQEE